MQTGLYSTFCSVTYLSCYLWNIFLCLCGDLPHLFSESESESEVAQSCPTLRDPMDCSPPGSSIRGIFQARVLEWGAIAFSDMATTYKISKGLISEVAQSCPTLRDPMDCSLPGSSVPGILQARVLEWVAISFSSV